MQFLKSMMSWRWLLAFAGLAFLAACDVTVVEDRPVSDGPRFCTREYAPVCARAGGDRQTFSNACEARVAGFRVIREGECRREVEPVGCTREYRPVCGVRRGSSRTFSNSCEADAAGYRVIDSGECRETPEESVSVCTREYAPVCGRRGGDIRTFGNSCEARAAEYRIIGEGGC